MQLNLDNEIDIKLLETFGEKTVNNIDTDKLGFILMNTSLEEDSEITFKIYYSHNYSKKLYEKNNHDFPIINFLKEHNLMSGFEISHDEYDKCKRFNVKLQNANNKNVLEMFDYLEKNTNFISKYKDEILNFSKIGRPTPSDWDYEPLFFIGFKNDKNNNIEQVKCYWINEVLDNDYYINFIKESGIEKLNNLLCEVQKIIPNTGRMFWGEGIDYSILGSSKHTLYFNYNEEIYNNIINKFTTDTNLTKNIKLITNWPENHPQFFCDGLAIRKNDNNNLTLNFYFRIRK